MANGESQETLDAIHGLLQKSKSDSIIHHWNYKGLELDNSNCAAMAADIL